MTGKILSIVGARPQFVKASAFHRAIREHGNIKHYILHTGQHYDHNLSEVFFKEMQIPRPNKNLGVGGGTHGENTGRMIEQIEKVLLEEEPSWVVLFGDTDSTLAGAIAASKLNIQVAHVEAGLRSWNRTMPEEINRVLTDHCSNILFTPSRVAENNLKSEGIEDEAIISTGDIMYDVALYFKEQIRGRNKIIENLGARPKQYALATIHRAENTNSQERLKSAFECLRCIDKMVVLPLHPRTAKAMKKYGLKLPSNVKSIPPLGYQEMLLLEMNASLIATDSGGVQKEAYFHKVPCITLRQETEWTELVDSGVNFIVGTDVKKMNQALTQVKQAEFDFSKNLYGDGRSAEKMIRALLDNDRTN
jgi:UDP-GlcNAc3NAcA epimerase